MPRGGAGGFDKHWLCHLCSEVDLVRYDRLNCSYKPMRGVGPPGFNSRPVLEAHMRLRHCVRSTDTPFEDCGPCVRREQWSRPKAMHRNARGRAKLAFVTWEGTPEEEGTCAGRLAVPSNPI